MKELETFLNSNISPMIGMATAGLIFYLSVNLRQRPQLRRILPCVEGITFRALNLALFASQLSEVLMPQYQVLSALAFDLILLGMMAWATVAVRRSWQPTKTTEDAHRPLPQTHLTFGGIGSKTVYPVHNDD